jgi:hypothetical protein
VSFKRKEKGGVNMQSLVPLTKLDQETVKAICAEYRIHNADITFRCNASADDLIDVIEGNRCGADKRGGLRRVTTQRIHAVSVRDEQDRRDHGGGAGPA